MHAPANYRNESHVRAALAQLIEEDSQLGKFERRSELRYPFFQPVTISFESGDHPLQGITRQISPSGIGLLHGAPLDLGAVGITMRDDDGYGVILPIEVTWCRPCGPHWYVSGGRFVDVAEHRGCSPTTDNNVPQQQGSNPGATPETPLLDDIVTSVRQTIAAVVDRPTYGSFFANRRSEERYCATLPVTASFADKTKSIRGSIRMVTRDISKNGIALISDQPIESNLLTLEISDRDGQKTLTALMQMLRCRPIGHLYEIAGKFVTKVYRD
jgi:hypothetical protein